MDTGQYRLVQMVIEGRALAKTAMAKEYMEARHKCPDGAPYPVGGLRHRGRAGALDSKGEARRGAIGSRQNSRGSVPPR